VRTKVSTKGQLVLPAEIREADRIEAGDEFDVVRVSPGEYRLTRRVRANAGFMRWLLACPEKDWFERSDFGTTDDV
jgi:AbrB family looped-hinge helix DNA binding protein